MPLVPLAVLGIVRRSALAGWRVQHGHCAAGFPASDGWRKARAARAFEHVLRQLAEFLQRRRAAAFFEAKSSRVVPE